MDVEEIPLPSEALRLYFTEVKDLHQEQEFEVEHVQMNGKSVVAIWNA